MRIQNRMLGRGDKRKNNMKKTKLEHAKEYVKICTNEQANEMKKVLLRPVWAPTFRETFIPIDRKIEDQDVLTFQRTKNVELLEKLYGQRVQTLKIWSSRNHYLDDSSDDMFAELSRVFVKAVHKYKKKKPYKHGNKVIWRSTPFNTYLYAALFNHIKNQYSSKQAKKRLPEGYDVNIILSLDHNYGSTDGSSITLMDIIANDMCSKEETHTEKAYFDDTMSILTKKDPPLIREFLVKLSEGGTIGQVLREYKRKNGRIKISKVMAKRLSKNRRCAKMVSDLIKEKSQSVNGDFKLLEYSIKGVDKLWFVVEMSKTPESETISKKLRYYRKHKDLFMKQIMGGRLIESQ